jgi:hypothetical protein
MNEMQAGISQIDITPPAGTWLVGCEGPSTGVHDPLFATVLVLEQRDVRHALISLDLCGLAQEDSRAIRSAVAQVCNTAPDRVTLMCSHTHSAPISIPWSLTGWQQHCAQDQAWTSALPQRMAQAAQEASQHMSATVLGYARAQVQIGQNRRSGGYTPGTQAVMLPDPDGSLVPWSDILAVHEPEGRLRAVLYSQAAHPVMVHKASPMISADYPVFAGQRIRERLGKGVMPMFAQGCGADNNAPWATGFDVCEQAGIQLGDAVAQACAHSTPISAPIHSESLVFDLPLKPLPSEAELEEAIRIQEQLLAHMPQALNISDKDVPFVLREQLQMVRNGSAPKTMPMEVQVLAFGRELAIVTLANEIFSGYQLAIDKFSPFQHTAVWAYCNTSGNYIPTDVEHARGGYEIHNGPRFYAYRAGPQVGTEKLILGHVSEMLARAYAAA